VCVNKEYNYYGSIKDHQGAASTADDWANGHQLMEQRYGAWVYEGYEPAGVTTMGARSRLSPNAIHSTRGSGSRPELQTLAVRFVYLHKKLVYARVEPFAGT